MVKTQKKLKIDCLSLVEELKNWNWNLKKLNRLRLPRSKSSCITANFPEGELMGMVRNKVLREAGNGAAKTCPRMIDLERKGCRDLMELSSGTDFFFFIIISSMKFYKMSFSIFMNIKKMIF